MGSSTLVGGWAGWGEGGDEGCWRGGGQAESVQGRQAGWYAGRAIGMQVLCRAGRQPDSRAAAWLLVTKRPPTCRPPPPVYFVQTPTPATLRWTQRAAAA